MMGQAVRLRTMDMCAAPAQKTSVATGTAIKTSTMPVASMMLMLKQNVVESVWKYMSHRLNALTTG